MSFPDNIERIFDDYGVPAETKSALYDLYLSMGEEVLDVFGEIAEAIDAPATLRPEHCATIRTRIVERYLARNHPRWWEGTPTPSFYRPRAAEGRASGIAIPMERRAPVIGSMSTDTEWSLPDGFLMQGRNAHFGGRSETITFDFVAGDLHDAIAIGQAAGRQHTLPGSVGATSGSIDSRNLIALIWEIQPNVFKPAGERNRAIARLYRQHRNWHVITLAAAVDWLRAQSFRVFIVRGEALPATHEVNREQPVSPTIIALHNRTVDNVLSTLGLSLIPAVRDDEQLLINSTVMNTGLQSHVARFGAERAVWRVG